MCKGPFRLNSEKLAIRWVRGVSVAETVIDLAGDIALPDQFK